MAMGTIAKAFFPNSQVTIFGGRQRDVIFNPYVNIAHRQFVNSAMQLNIRKDHRTKKSEPTKNRKAERTTKRSNDSDLIVRISGLLTTGFQRGLVIERLGDRVLIEYPLESPPFQRQRAVCLQRQQFLLSQEHIVPGDIVYFKHINNNDNIDNSTLSSKNATAFIEELHPRNNVLQRPSAGSTRKKVTMKPIASNIDQLLVVVATQPLVPLHTLDRYIVSARVHNIPEVHFVINKADLPDTKDLYNYMRHYEKLGHRLILASTSSNASDNNYNNKHAGLDTVRNLLRGKTSIFVGQSGVGKSSLINALFSSSSWTPSTFSGEMLRVGDLVGNNLYGAHTTSNAKLYHLPAPTSESDSNEKELNDSLLEKGNPSNCFEKEGDEVVSTELEIDHHEKDNAIIQFNDSGSWGRIIDSPGIRELGIWHLPSRVIQEGFHEIHHHAQFCKFRNCKHDNYDMQKLSEQLDAANDAKFTNAQVHRESKSNNKANCGVVAAVEAGEIHPARYAHFLALRDQHHD